MDILVSAIGNNVSTSITLLLAVVAAGAGAYVIVERSALGGCGMIALAGLLLLHAAGWPVPSSLQLMTVAATAAMSALIAAVVTLALNSTWPPRHSRRKMAKPAPKDGEIGLGLMTQPRVGVATA